MKKLLRNLGRYWFLILIGVVIIFSVASSSNSQPLPPPVPSSQTQAANADNDQQTPSLPAVSLPNGTVLKERLYYLNGDGTLEIDNGTTNDAVAKLITGGTSVFTVYIRAGGDYTIRNITNGTYWLAFALGNDWDSATKTFEQPAGDSSFADTFDFTATDNGNYIDYDTYQVTLNAVEGGTAQTNDVDQQQFNAY